MRVRLAWSAVDGTLVVTRGYARGWRRGWRCDQERIDTEMRRQARLNELQEAEARRSHEASEKARLEKDIGRRVSSWARGKGIRQMLESLPNVLLVRVALT